MTPEQQADKYAGSDEANRLPIGFAQRYDAFLAGYRAGQVDARHPPVVAAARELARTMDEEVPWRQWPQPVLAAWEALRAALEAQSQPLEPRKLTDEQADRLCLLAENFAARTQRPTLREMEQATTEFLTYVESLLEGQK